MIAHDLRSMIEMRRSHSVIVAEPSASYVWCHDGLRTLHRRPPPDRGRVAGTALPGGVPRASTVGHRGAVHRRVRGHQDNGDVPLPGVWGEAVRQRDQVRFALRLAVLR